MFQQNRTSLFLLYFIILNLHLQQHLFLVYFIIILNNNSQTINMKTFYRTNRDYYPDISSSGYTSARSQHQKQNLSSSKVSQTKSKYQHRIQKACGTNTLESYKKETILLKKQLQRLQKQSLKKDNRIFQMQSTFNVTKQLQSQLQQTYRIIYMYQGKIQELQKQLKRLQTKISNNFDKTINAQEIQSLLNQYRYDNTQMRGVIQEQNRIIMELQNKFKTIQSKYFQTSWKVNTQNRIIANPLKKKFPKLRDTIVIQQMSLKQRQKMMGEIENKYQENNKQVMKQNQRLKMSSLSHTNKRVSINGQQRNTSLYTKVNEQNKASRVSNTGSRIPYVPKDQNVASKVYTFNAISQASNGSRNYAQKRQNFSPPKLSNGVERIYSDQYSNNNNNYRNNNKSGSYQFYRSNYTPTKSQQRILISQSQPILTTSPKNNISSSSLNSNNRVIYGKSSNQNQNSGYKVLSSSQANYISSNSGNSNNYSTNNKYIDNFNNAVTYKKEQPNNSMSSTTTQNYYYKTTASTTPVMYDTLNQKTQQSNRSSRTYVYQSSGSKNKNNSRY